MKIYTTINEHYVGLVLLSDKGEEYFNTAFQVESKDNVDKHILGISRAISWVKNNEPLYAKNKKIEIGASGADKKELEKRIKKNEFIQRFISQNKQHISFIERLSDKDNYFIRIASNAVKFEEIRMKYMDMKSKEI